MVYQRTMLAAALVLATGASAGPPTPRDGRGAASPTPTVMLSAPQAMVLRPLRAARHGNTKRDRTAALGLKAEEIFHWHGEDGTLAQFQVQMPGHTENIVNLETISDMIQGVECLTTGSGHLGIKFTDAADFHSARDVWQWVNRDAANHFVLVVGAGDCGSNEERVVYDVAGLAYDAEAHTAVLDVRQTTWREMAHTFDLVVGKPSSPGELRRRSNQPRFDFGDIGKAIAGEFDKFTSDAGRFFTSKLPEVVTSQVPKVITSALPQATGAPLPLPPPPPQIQPIDVTKGFSIPFNNDLSNKSVSLDQDDISIPVNASIAISCGECFTAGKFDVKGRFRAEQLLLKEAYVEITTPELVAARAAISLRLTGALDGNLVSTTVPLFSTQPQKVVIPDVLTIGPHVSVDLAVEVSKVSGDITLEAGGRVEIPAASSLRLDLLDRAGTRSVGWQPSFRGDPLRAQGFTEAKVTTMLRPVIGLGIEVIGTSFA